MDSLFKSSCGVGFVCSLRREQSHEIIKKGIEAVSNITHRGAVGGDGKTGDGAGILIELPKRFFMKEAESLGYAMPAIDALAVGVFFLYTENLEPMIEAILKGHELRPIGWRNVPVDTDALGASASASMPEIKHLFIDTSGVDARLREARLFLARREMEITLGRDVYIPSLSGRTIVYKGMLIAPLLSMFYPDLKDPDMASTFCLFHQRFSTNTSPDWTLAQPFRMLGHNGEINTLSGNRNYVTSIEHLVGHPIFGDRAGLLRPLVSYEESDSASLDRIIELMVLSGMRPEHALNICIPPAWENNAYDEDLKAFFEYNALLMPPWDGPAAVAFTDGETIGAHMDRNGLRPLRYTITDDGLFVLGSETGMVELGDRKVITKDRLGPGETVSVNIRTGAVMFTEEIIKELAAQRPYGEWARKYLVHIKGPQNDDKKISEGYGASPAEQPLIKEGIEGEEITRRQIAFGYTEEEIDASIKVMASTGKEPVFSMGDDTPLPPLSDRPPLLFRYFKQKFSQVTNPAIDPIRERMVMSLKMYLGTKANFIYPRPECCRRLVIESPVLSSHDMREIKAQIQFRIKRISITYPGADVRLCDAIKSIQRKIVEAVREGAEIIILSDSDMSKELVAAPSLLAVSACYGALKKEGLADRASIVIETGEARDEHHIACLVGFGASAVYPYLAYETIHDLCRSGRISLPYEQAVSNYKAALEAGLLKSIARMGISTIRSYHNGRIFDSICLNRDFVEEFMPGVPVTIESDGIEQIEASVIKRHRDAYDSPVPALDTGGHLRYRRDGEYHAWSGPVVAGLNRFIKSGDYTLYREFAHLANSRPVFIRHLMDYRKTEGIPIDEVEPVEEILKRFVAGAMSIGALSPEAHETIAEACNRLGIKSNSGEGGEDPARYFGPKNSAIKQIASGRFGVTPTYIASALDLEIKIAQGAKPGEGGLLPGIKVDKYIAMLRHCEPNTLLISPPPHHDIYSIEDLAQLIHDLKQANPKARVCVKLVAETGVGTIAAGVAKAYADIVQISGCEGGTGAATISSIKNVGNYWEIGLAETQRTLMENSLRGRIRLRVDGGIRTGRDVVIAALLGAEEFGFGTATMVSAGCVMARVCHSNTCPTGIATQDMRLRQRFRGTVEGIMSYFRAVAQETREILSEMGKRSLSEIIGRPEILYHTERGDLPGSRKIYINGFLDTYYNSSDLRGPRTCTLERNDNPAPSLNDRIVEDLMPFIEKAVSVSREYRIRNIDRSIPSRLNYHIALRYKDMGLPADTIRLTFRGTAGQSFGAFNHNGLSLTLIGDANDYVGKGMFGGRITIVPDGLDEPYRHVIIGNTCLYGAIGGEFFAAGRAGERFAVRNSGAVAVIEGAGQHLCEYMTRGTVVVLGEVGYNIGAGMTGGDIFILDEDDGINRKINSAYVVSSPVQTDQDITRLRRLIEKHHTLTGSIRAWEILSRFEDYLKIIKKVVPV